jgi:hypothetical protein
MSSDDSIVGGWQTLVPSRNGQVGRLIRLDGPPPPTKEEWARPVRYGGSPTHVYILRDVASTSWSVSKGFSTQPRELALYLVRLGHARLAKPGEMPTNEGE